MVRYSDIFNSVKKNRQPRRLGGAAALLPVLSVSLFGCATTLKSDTVPENDGYASILIAQPCDTVETDSADTEQKVDGIFIEAVWNIKSVIPDPVGDWLQHNPVKTNSTGGTKVENNTPYIFNVENSKAPANSYSLVVTPTFTENTGDAISISVKATKGDNQEIVLAQKTVVTRHQKPVVVRFNVENESIPNSPIVITPYLLAGEASMQRLLFCKMSNTASHSKPDDRQNR